MYWGEKIPDNLIYTNTWNNWKISTSQTDDISFRYDCTEIFNNFKQPGDDVVVIVGRFPLWINDVGKNQLQCSEDCDHIRTIESRIRKIAKNTEKVILIYPVSHILIIFLNHISIGKFWVNCTTDIEYWEEISSDSYHFLNSIKGNNIERIFTEDLFCNSFTSNSCVAATKETLLYADDNHLTVEGNYIVLNEIIKLLK